MVELREIELRNKPEAMLLVSPKGTVPVLVLGNGQVIDESLDIMVWALQQHDPEHWLASADPLVEWNDGEFKYYLDRYKYADRFPDFSARDYRQQAERFLAELERQLIRHAYLCGDHFSITDAAILPFIRQFAAVDSVWFEAAPYPAVQRWLQEFLAGKHFKAVMSQYAPWKPGDPPRLWPFRYELTDQRNQRDGEAATN